VNNSFWYKTYFSTYGADSSIEVASLGGSVTLRQGVSLPSSDAGSSIPVLQAWIGSQLLLSENPASASYYQPWLRLNESSVDSFQTLASVMPPNLQVSAFSGISICRDLSHWLRLQRGIFKSSPVAR
jgi:hypothetical protein